jgi:cyclophilin family peptidyl-prolyl cis-trans isomerase
MNRKLHRHHQIAAVLVFVIAMLPAIGTATVVEIETNLGTFEVNLYDNDTPATVANFLAYVQNGDYSDSVIHRSMSGFIVQGGGLVTDGNANLSSIPGRPAVQNEPVYSNVRGSILCTNTKKAPPTVQV